MIGIVVVGIATTAALTQPRTILRSPDKTQAQAQTGSKEYSLADVAAHKDGTSCWTAINGEVYDLTSWIAQHPGGEGAILSICGKDGSDAFNNQHGGQGKPEAALATFKIGGLLK